MEITQFTATLFYSDSPKVTTQALIEAWGLEGYTCELSEEFDPRLDFFRGFRGGTFVHLQKPSPIQIDELPDHYPENAQTDIDFDKTYLINPRAALEGFQGSLFQSELLFRVVKDEDQPRVAHNEWAAVLLGIFQVCPINAVWAHQTGVLIGREDLAEYTSYANTQSEEGGQFAPSLAFGVFCIRDGNLIKAWSTGLEHFSHQNLYVENSLITPQEACQIVFNVGYSITANWRFEVGQTAEAGGFFCKIQAAELFDEAVLQFVPV
ncbi:hypothetical protein ABHF33_00520 [Chitinibacter sp. FCG-7]|uniref:DUF4261 domain-containing protein n=1 Tax=Chitinibacter mangrovi TaxID=3153927 RepID=A0AAU7FA48_9NEIS